MSDMTKRGPDDCDDCEGERGKRGKRGHRGHRGHDGHDGATGPTGPSSGPTGFTGPTGSTGFTGPQGPTGTGQGLRAYGYAVNFGQQTVNETGPVIFSLGGLVFPNAGITPPAPGGTSFTILSTGDYEYIFYAVGQHDNAATVGMQFAIFVNGVAAVPVAGHEFHSNVGDNANDVQLARGEGIIHLSAGDVVTLVNRTGNGTIKVQLIGTTESSNATLSLKKLSA